MTMHSDELRALADALEPMAKAPRFEDMDVPAFCRWLRAQADAQPVAWIAHNLTTGHVKWTTDRCRAHGWIQGGNLRVKSLYTHPAPSAPAGWKWVPVEPTPEMLHAEIGGKDWNGKTGDERARALWVAMLAAAPAAPQAEPLSDDEISKLAWKQNLWTDGMIEFSFVALAREVERAHGISGGGHD